MVKPLVQDIVTAMDLPSSLTLMFPLIGALLQYTDSFNFGLLGKIKRNEPEGTHCMMAEMVNERDLGLASDPHSQFLTSKTATSAVLRRAS